MSNMSYCRFSNTLQDLRECYDSEGMYDPDLLSEEEQKAREKLINLCSSIAFDNQEYTD